MKMFLVLALLVGFVACKSSDKPADVVPVVPSPTPLVCEDGAVPNGLGQCVIQPPADVGVWCFVDEVDFGPCLDGEWFQQPENKACGPIGKRVSGRNAHGGCSPAECKFSCNPVMNFFKSLVN